MNLKPFIIFAFTTVCVGFQNIAANAQHAVDSAMLVKLTGRFNLESLTFPTPSAKDSGSNADFQSVTGQGTVFSAGAHVSVPILFDGRFRIGTGFMYSRRERTMQFNQPGFAVRPLDEQTWYISASDRLDLSMDVLQFELTGQWRITDNIFLHGGPVIGYRFAPEFTLPNDGVLTIINSQINNPRVGFDFSQDGIHAIVNSPEGENHIKLPDEELVFTSSETDGTLELGVFLGVSYTLSIGGNYLIAPELTIHASTAPTYAATSGTGFSGGIGFSLMRTFPVHGKPISADTTPSTPPNLPNHSTVTPISESEPSITIAVHGTDTEGEPLPYVDVNVYETLRWDRHTQSWQTAQHIEQPVLLLDPSYPENTQEWDIVFRYGNSEIARGSSTDETPLSSVDWSVAPAKDSIQPLIVEFMVRDSSGHTTTVRSEIPVRVNRAVRLVDREKDHVTFTLYRFAQNSDVISTQNELVLKEVLSALDEKSRVTVTGFIEESGETTHAIDLSTRRTRQVIQRLQQLYEGSGFDRLNLHASAYELYPGAYRKRLPEATSVQPHIEILVVFE